MNRRTKFVTFRRGRLSVYAVLAAVALGVTACGGDAEGQPANSASPAASAVASEIATTTPTPSVTPEYKPASADGPAENVPLPEMPKAATQESKKGLASFAEYWYDLLSYAYESGNTEPIREVTSSDCSRCKAALKVIDEWHKDGRWLVGGKAEIAGTGKEMTTDPHGVYQLPVQVRFAELNYYSNGDLHTNEPASSGHIDLVMASFDDDGWTVQDLGVVGGT